VPGSRRLGDAKRHTAVTHDIHNATYMYYDRKSAKWSSEKFKPCASAQRLCYKPCHPNFRPFDVALMVGQTHIHVHRQPARVETRLAKPMFYELLRNSPLRRWVHQRPFERMYMSPVVGDANLSFQLCFKKSPEISESPNEARTMQSKALPHGGPMGAPWGLPNGPRPDSAGSTHFIA